MKLGSVPVVETQMLIRRPVVEVFIDPTITSEFWFTKGSGKLEPGANVRWDWEMYGASADVHVKEIEPNRQIFIEWGEPDATPTTVEWAFFPQSDGTTFVRITNAGFSGDGDAVVAQAIGSMGGFTNLLAGAKAYLEHNIMLNLVADHFPSGIEQS